MDTGTDTTQDWLLTAAQRGNPQTIIDARHGDVAHTSGNAVHPHIDGVSYFARLVEVVDGMRPGDLLLFTDWRGDPDERLTPDGPTVAELFARAARRGVDVRGLFWRSHLDRFHYSEAQNRTIADEVNLAGGQVLLDMRVRPLGCHHQKFVVARHPGRPELDVAFIGGIDLCHTRRDDHEHGGDPQAVAMAPVWGPHPPWHDAQLEVCGPAVGDAEATFRERWNDPTPLTQDPVSRVEAFMNRDDPRGAPLPVQQPDPPAAGTAHVQVLRTYAAKIPRFPFAPSGERSIARAYDKAMQRARGLVHIEDQYFWNPQVCEVFANALRGHPELRLVIVLARYTSQAGAVSEASGLVSRVAALREVCAAGGDRVGVYGLENPQGTPVYVHAKVCVVDDVWATIGSDNVNLRSWTYDSEMTCGVLDEERDPREPRRVGADEARVFARDLRLRLTREHLDRADGDDADLLDPISAFEAIRASAGRLQAWYDADKKGPRPPGRLRPYVCPDLHGLDRISGTLLNRIADDPDGRPLRLHGTDRF